MKEMETLIGLIEVLPEGAEKKPQTLQALSRVTEVLMNSINPDSNKDEEKKQL